MSNLGDDDGIEPGSKPFQNDKLTCDDSSADSVLENNTLEYDDYVFGDTTGLLYPNNDLSMSIPPNPCYPEDADNDDTPEDRPLPYHEVFLPNSYLEPGVGVGVGVGVGNDQFGQLAPQPSIELPDVLILSANNTGAILEDSNIPADLNHDFLIGLLDDEPPQPTRRLTREMKSTVLEAYRWFPREMTIKEIANRITIDWLVPRYK